MEAELQAQSHPFHDFAAKLRQSGFRETVLRYLQWQKEARSARNQGKPTPPFPDIGPLSINLDLTTACNYACDHCIDWDSLNSPIRHQESILKSSLEQLIRRGLRSVILIGGGEPTLYPGFLDMVAFLKQRKLQVAVVSNGSRNDRLAEAAPLLSEGDWIRLSLDAGSDSVFRAMHKPKSAKVTLPAICRSAESIKSANPAVTLGFSFVIVWRGARREDQALVENLDEIAQAASLAKQHQFDYISLKPFLTRAEDGAEVMDPSQSSDSMESVLERLQGQLQRARSLADDKFKVIESTNLKALCQGQWQNYTRQPKQCHMQALRQVLSPLGTFNCPAHRGVSKARLGGIEIWGGDGAVGAGGTASILQSFDASEECKEVTCLYHPVNHFLEALLAGEEDLEAALGEEVDMGDFFL
ncbi:MAG: radical SAM protein [Planctomycetota bacterium]|nr:MAG: radical SAM protein [Planctomycetota bacterium]